MGSRNPQVENLFSRTSQGRPPLSAFLSTPFSSKLQKISSPSSEYEMNFLAQSSKVLPHSSSNQHGQICPKDTPFLPQGCQPWDEPLSKQ